MANTASSPIDTIARLLRLAEGNGTNPNEAAVAAAQAARLMAKHRLERSDVDATADRSEPIKAAKDDPLFTGAQMATWVSALGSGVARSQGCRIYISRFKRAHRLILIGRASDASVVRYLFTYLRREIDRLCDEAVNSNTIGVGRTERNNFRLGAVSTVIERLTEAKREAERECAREHGQQAATTAIVRVDQRAGEVDKWVENNLKLRSAGSRSSSYSASARDAGRAAGRGIALNRGIGGSVGGGLLGSGS